MRLFFAFAAILITPTLGFADPGAVDWGARVVKCSGSGAANLRDADNNPAVARIGAEKAAKLDALRNCMETIKGIQLDSSKKVGSELEGNSALNGTVQGIVRGFRVVGSPRYFSDGGVEMDVELPLDGKLSDALLPRIEGAKVSMAGEAPGSALVVDARGQKVTPALAPRVLDESGNEIYGPAMLNETGRKAGGTAAYTKDLALAKTTLADRLGDKPIIVKAVRIAGSDFVISTSDAASLSGKNLGFLAYGRVVILAD